MGEDKKGLIKKIFRTLD
jgi:hypothetical protein